MFKKLLVFLALVGIAAGITCHAFIGTRKQFNNKEGLLGTCEGNACTTLSSPEEILAGCADEGMRCSAPELAESGRVVTEEAKAKGKEAYFSCCESHKCNSGHSLSTFLSSLLPLTLSFLSAGVYSMQ